MKVDIRPWELLATLLSVAIATAVLVLVTFDSEVSTSVRIVVSVAATVLFLFSWGSGRGTIVIVRGGTVFDPLRPVRRVDGSSIDSLRIERSERFPGRLDIVADIIDGDDRLVTWIWPHFWEPGPRATWAAEERVRFIEDAVVATKP